MGGARSDVLFASDSEDVGREPDDSEFVSIASVTLDKDKVIAGPSGDGSAANDCNLSGGGALKLSVVRFWH